MAQPATARASQSLLPYIKSSKSGHRAAASIGDGLEALCTWTTLNIWRGCVWVSTSLFLPVSLSLFLSLFLCLFFFRVSSVLDGRREFGKQNLFDGLDETCWNSDQGTPQFSQDGHTQGSFGSVLLARLSTWARRGI